MKILAFPAYSGEFGWELFAWQGYLRKIKEELQPDLTYGYCFEPFEMLYKDFADVLIPVTSIDRKTVPSAGYMEHLLYDLQQLGYGKDDEIYFIQAEPTISIWNQQQLMSYKSYKKDVPKEYDVLLHPRQMDHRPEDNDSMEWNGELLDVLSDAGLKVATFGTSKGSQRILGYDGFFDRPLNEVADLINKSRYVIGQSSGPLHFAALCEAETIVWSTTKEDGSYGLKERYEKIWNPFDNKVNYIVKPTPEKILEIVSGKVPSTN